MYLEQAKIMINKWLYNALAFFLRLISLLPLRLLYLFSDVVYFVLFYIVKYRRHVVLKNLTNSFPDKSIDELKRIEKNYYAYLADLMAEGIKMISASPEYIFKRYQFKNTALLKSFEAQNQNYIIAVGHYGNWEWNTIVTPMVIQAKPLIIYKPLTDKNFDNFFKKMREKSGSIMISMKNSMRKIAEYRNQLSCIIFAADQTPAGNGAYTWLNFLNQKTAIFTGIEKIAKSTNYPVIFCNVKVVGRGRYEAEFMEITDKPRETAELEITKKYTELMEKSINEKPEYWLWSHKRWKIKPEQH